MKKNFFLNRIFIVFLFPFLLGSLSVFSFQPFNLFFFNFLIIPFLFLILSYVNKKSKNIYIKKPYLKNLFFVGFFFGIGFFLAGTHWISYSLTFDESFKYLIPISLILLPSFLAIFLGLVTLIIGPYLKNDLSSILIFSVALSLENYIRSKILTGFPWNLWSYSISQYTEMIQILNFIGIFAFNLIVVTVFCSPLLIFFKNFFINRLIFVLFFLLVLFNHIFGSIILNKNEEKITFINNHQENYKIISPNFKLNYELSKNDIEVLIKKLIKFSEPEKNKETIFIWPEGIFTGYNLSDIIYFKKLIKANFSDKHKIIFGVNSFNKEKNETFNSMVLIDNEFKILNKYDKKKLVPFGEFLPFENILNKTGIKKITHGYGSFSRGSKQKNFYVNQSIILPLICYEIIFTELVQKAEDFNIIINISEDAWFGDSIGPYQHFAKAIFRAVESNTFVLRSANKGVSAFINNRGQVVKSLSPNEVGNIEMKVPIFNNRFKNRNDLIFFLLLFTYTIIFFTLRKKLNDKK